MCLGTVMYVHDHVWAQTCLGTNVSGHKCDVARTCVLTNVARHSRVGTNVVEPSLIAENWLLANFFGDYLGCYMQHFSRADVPSSYATITSVDIAEAYNVILHYYFSRIGNT